VPEANETDNIAARLTEVRQRIDEAVLQAGRAPGSTRLIAVSKGKPLEMIRAAYASGQRDFGENYVQELEEKAKALGDLEGLRWHAIGRLQRNKVKQVVRIASVVHAVDREELVGELERRANAAGIRVEALIEVNIAGEASKGGCSPDKLGALLTAIRTTASVKVVGLMTIPPETIDREQARPVFAALRELRDRHGGPEALPELSMGMTNDFVVAIAEGATMVRVGTAIFGSRSERVTSVRKNE
jgi:PLP dependent protein